MVDQTFVEPAYGERSLGDVLPAVGRALGVDAGLPETSLQLPEAPAYVVFLIDGLGYQLVAEHPDEAPFLHESLGASGTAGVPSTTSTSLTSLGTAMSPGQHGVVGFTARVPGTERLLNSLYWDKQVDPLEWQPHPTAFERLAQAGVDTTVIGKRIFEGSGLTQVSQRGAHFVGADGVGEQMAEAVRASAGRPSLTYVYDSDLDSTGHKYGVNSAQWRSQLEELDATAEQMRDSLPPEVRLLVVADHGMVDCDDESRIDIDAHPELRSGVILLGGEARFRHVYCASGAVDDVVATWREVLGERADVLTREQAVCRGWFGSLDAPVRPRLGDVVVAARGNTGLFSSVDFAYETTLIGLHGSLSPREMLIPILVS